MREVDLNLLVVLDVLLQERSVTQTAERLRLTPSAVSHALKRLRQLFDDELLVRDGRRMSPTARAHQLSDTLPRALAHLAGTLTAPEPFNPATSTRTFRLAAPDFLAPRILRAVGIEAPSVRVEWAPRSVAALRELSQGHYDALIAPRAVKHEGLRGTLLGEWPWRVYGRAKHPAFESWSLESWSAYPHVQIGTSVIRGQGPVEERVSELGIERHIGAVVPYFSMAVPLVAATDLLLTLPSVSVEESAEVYGLQSREPPFELPKVSLSLFCSATEGDEPGVRWFREVIQRACHDLA